MERSGKDTNILITSMTKIMFGIVNVNDFLYFFLFQNNFFLKKKNRGIFKRKGRKNKHEMRCQKRKIYWIFCK